MLDITYGILFTDQVVGSIAIIVGLGYWYIYLTPDINNPLPPIDNKIPPPNNAQNNVNVEN